MRLAVCLTAAERDAIMEYAIRAGYDGGSPFLLRLWREHRDKGEATR